MLTRQATEAPSLFTSSHGTQTASTTKDILGLVDFCRPVHSLFTEFPVPRLNEYLTIKEAAAVVGDLREIAALIEREEGAEV